MKSFFHIDATAHREIISLLNSGKKIGAIKVLRRETDCSLREAKYAIERILHEKFGQNYPIAVAEGARITSMPRIKRVVLDYGQGDIEVDLEQMQMITLMEMQSTGLEACREILSLVDTLKAYSNGKNIGILAEEPEE